MRLEDLPILVFGNGSFQVLISNRRIQLVHSTNLRVVYREKCYCAFQEKTAQRRIDEVSLETDGSTKEHIHLELNSKFHISRNTNNVVLGNHAVTVIPSDTDLVETSWKIFWSVSPVDT